MKKILFLFLAFLAIMSYESCVKGAERVSCGCDNTCVQYYRVKSPVVQNVKIDTSISSFYWSNIDTTAVFARQLGWVVSFQQVPYCQTNTNFPSLFPTAKADRLIAAPYANQVCKEKVDVFTVTTIDDFDNLHLAGSDIADILDITWTAYYSTGLPKMRLQDFMAYDNRPMSTGFLLSLRKSTPTNRVVRAKIHIQLSSGQVFDLETAPITVII